MEKDKVLVVDDVSLNREILIDILKDDYEVLQAADGFEALLIISQQAENLKLILLDIIMPRMNGFEVLAHLREYGLLSLIPVVIVSAASDAENEIKGLELGCADFVSKPFHPQIVKHRVAAQIELNNHRRDLENKVKEAVASVMKVREAVIDMMASVIEHRHVESGQHVKRTRTMAEYLLQMVRTSGEMNDELEGIRDFLLTRAIPLHDIGKISIPDNILLKPGKLDNDEFEIMKQHTVKGAEIIDSMRELGEPEYLGYCKEICLGHHEKWDGSGYPRGLKGREIPFSARIMAIVDVYDALTSERVYKKALSHEEALEIIFKGLGTHFDPNIGRIFIRNKNWFREDHS